MPKEPGLVWSEPPAASSPYDWFAIALELRANPMRWAKVFEGDKHSIVTALRGGSIRVLHPNLGFEFSTRGNRWSQDADGRPVRYCDLFMRYNPDRVSETRRMVEEGIGN